MKPEASKLLRGVGPVWASVALVILAVAVWTLLNPGHPVPHRYRYAFAKTHMRDLAVGLETYFVDHNVYPDAIERLTTPVAYVEQLSSPIRNGYAVKYHSMDGTWFLIATGSDRTFEIDDSTTVTVFTDKIYDPTNGVVSPGDIVRTELGVFDPSLIPSYTSGTGQYTLRVREP